MTIRYVEQVRTFTVARRVVGDTRGPWGWWCLTRFRALVDACQIEGMPFAVALRCSSAVVCHWVIEVGWNTREWNYNGANSRGDWRGESVMREDVGGLYPFKAFLDLQSAATSTVLFLSHGRYAASWAGLVAGDSLRDWFAAVLRAGYSSYSDAAVQQYVDVVGLVARRYAAYLDGRPAIDGVPFAD